MPTTGECRGRDRKLQKPLAPPGSRGGILLLGDELSKAWQAGPWREGTDGSDDLVLQALKK